MEDSNALILRFDSDDSRKIWQNRLQGAIYRASVCDYLSCMSLLVFILNLGLDESRLDAIFSLTTGNIH